MNVRRRVKQGLLQRLRGIGLTQLRRCSKGLRIGKLFAVTRREDEGNALLPEPLGELEAGFFAQVYVEERKVGQTFFDLLQGITDPGRHTDGSDAEIMHHVLRIERDDHAVLDQENVLGQCARILIHTLAE
jgi:hypothetical protein